MTKKLIYGLAFWVLIGLFLPLSAWAANSPVGVSYRGHIQDRGDYPVDGSWVDSPELIGTVGQSKRIEGFEIKLNEDLPIDLSIRYNVHVQNRGWLYDENDSTDWPRDGAYAGTRGESLRIEAVKIVLTDSAGKPVTGYSVQYRGHVQNVGDQPQAADDWLADGDQLGTVGSSLRLEALLVRVIQNKADLMAYNALVAKVDKLNEADFTAKSWAALQTALKAHLVTTNQSQTEVDDAVKAIKLAYDGLEKKAAPTVYDKAGTFGPASGSETIEGDVTVDVDGVILQNLTITGDLLISEAVGNGTVTLNNVTVDGDTVVRGGGANSIHINGGQYSWIVMEKTASGAVRIVAKDVDGLDVVIAEDASGETIILEGAFDSVEVNAPNMTVTTQGNTTTIGKMTVGTAGAGSTVTVNPGTTVADLILDGKAAVKGQGNVVKAEVKVDGVVFDKKPGSYTVAPGVVIPPVFPTPSDGGGGYNPPSPVAVTGVSLDQASLSVGVTRTAQLNATVSPNNAANKTVTWTSSDDTIATVDATGKVTGKKEGQAAITVKTDDGNKTASCTVTVTTSFEVIQTADGTGVITGMNGSSTVIVIPETIDGLTITGIGDQAFFNRNITSVEIPKTVKTIGSRAFAECRGLKTVTLPTGLTAIGAGAFKNCYNMISITIPKGVNTIGAAAFSYDVDKKPVNRCYTFRGDVPTTLESGALPTTAPTPTIRYYGNYSGYTASAWIGYSDKQVILEKPVMSEQVVTNTGTPAVELKWGSCPEATGYQVYVGENSDLSAATSIAVSETHATINTGLEAGKEYYFAVKARDDYGESQRSDVVFAKMPYQYPVTSIDISATPATLVVGKTGQLSAALTPANASNQTVSWSSGNDTIATVDAATGVMTAKAAGTVEMTGTTADGGKTGTCQVTVVPDQVTGVTLDQSSLSVWVTKTAQLTATVEPAGVSNPTVNWSSSDATVATVDDTGKVKGVKEGSTTITATTVEGSFIKTCTVTVTEGYDVSVTNNKATITKYYGDNKAVHIPDTIDVNGTAVPVAAIGESAFSGLGITAVTIPATVTSIGFMAFRNCTLLTTVSFDSESQLTTIGPAAFQECRALQTMVLPETVTTINSYAFAWCYMLTTINLPASLETLETAAFIYCQRLTSITIPAQITSIPQGAFMGCYGLTSVTLPANLTAIGPNAFRDCTKLTDITIPDKVARIGATAFCFVEGTVPTARSFSFMGNAPTLETDAIKEADEGTAITIKYKYGSTGFDVAPWTDYTRVPIS